MSCKNTILKIKVSLLGLILFAAVTNAQNYKLVWFENFSGTSLDQNSWTYESGGHGWGNNELQYYTNRQENSFIEDGKLIIRANKESYSGKNYTSARLVTKGKKSFKYGKIEARIKLPFGQGIWPAFWMLGNNIDLVSWPACGETDIMEMIGGGSNDKTIYGTAHWSNNGTHASYGGRKTLVTSDIFADDFHIFGIEWTETYIKWLLDGNQYHAIDITPSELSELHNEMFIILNVAVGGNWPGSPDATTQFPQQMEVDYIRVFQDMPTSVETEDAGISDVNLTNFPNPFNNRTNIVFNSPVNSSYEADLMVTNIIGQVIKSEKLLIKPGSNQYSIELPDGSNSGIYFILLNNGSKSYSRKIVYVK